MAEKFARTEIGEERLCSQCQEYWPNTSEYFYHQNKAKGILMAACKACYIERRYPNGRSQTTRYYAGRAR